MQAKRKENEDEVAKELRRAELRRKKFKEALLEKALKARVDKVGRELPSLADMMSCLVT